MRESPEIHFLKPNQNSQILCWFREMWPSGRRAAFSTPAASRIRQDIRRNPPLRRTTLLCAAGLAGWVVQAQAAEVRSHRGNLWGQPEHTLEGYDSVINVGAQVIEIDVQLTSDGIPICLHDGTLDRTTTGTGPSAARTLAEIKELDAGVNFGFSFAGRKVPTLKEALIFLSQRRAKVLLEPKVDAPAEIAGAIAAAGYPRHRVSVLIFTPGAASPTTALRQYAAINPEWPLWLVSAGTPTSVGTEELTHLRAAGWRGLSFWPNTFTPGDYQLAHSLGRQVGVCAVDGDNVMSYVDDGADLLLTDNPGGLPNSLMPGYVTGVWNRFVTGHGLSEELARQQADADADGLSNFQEFVYGTNPTEIDAIPPGSGPVMETAGPPEEREIILSVTIPPQKVECVWFSVLTSFDGISWSTASGSQIREDHSAWPADSAWRFRIDLPRDTAPTRALYRLDPHFFPRP